MALQLSAQKGQKDKSSLNLRKLRLSLKFRPKLFRLILKLKLQLQKKNAIISKGRKLLQGLLEPSSTCDNSTQTDMEKSEHSEKVNENAAWNLSSTDGATEKSIAEQVKEAAQSAMAQSGMVYVEEAGMYYDYKTGYYYNSELGLYYHPDTGCYYKYSEEEKTFAFFSYPDTSKITANEALKKHEKRKAKKHKQEQEEQKQDGNKPKTKRKKTKENGKETEHKQHDDKVDTPINTDCKSETEDRETKEEVKSKCDKDEDVDLEDGECSDTASEAEGEGNVSTSTASDDDDDSIARHHPPCMRVIVKETCIPKLKVGMLFLITKDGGTVGREGEQHTILLKEHDVSRSLKASVKRYGRRKVSGSIDNLFSMIFSTTYVKISQENIRENHLHIRYDSDKMSYVAMDLGSKNGTILNGSRMSQSQQVSNALEIVHGSTLQLGGTKLLCHIHPGTVTCGHCEPGLIMAADEEEKRVAYTRTCSVQKQHQLELARLKNKYAPEPLAIEDGSYKDRAKSRREAVGSSHHAEKTQQSDLDTSIEADNKGFQLLKKMGWSKGEGLGKDKQGETEPVPLVNNEHKVGFGARGSSAPVNINPVGVPMKLISKSKVLRPPAKLFRDPLEDSDGE